MEAAGPAPPKFQFCRLPGTGSNPANEPDERGLIDPTLEHRRDGCRPDFIALRDGMKMVGGTEADESAICVEELIVDVDEEDMLLVIEPRDDLVGSLHFEPA